MRVVSLIALFLVACASATPKAGSGGARTPPSERSLEYVKSQLPNGLSVIVQENHASKAVALQVWVKAGSADETPTESGVAHLSERLVLKGTKKRPGDTVAREVEGLGGEIGSFTGFDQTVFHLTMSSRFFDQGLEILADSLQDPSFDGDTVKGEVATIRDELRRANLDPAQRFLRRLFDSAYSQHPYRRPILGDSETSAQLTRDQAHNFYQQWYKPDRTVLVIVGDVELATAKAKAEGAFSGWQKSSKPPSSTRSAEPKAKDPKVVVSTENLADAHVAFSYRIPGIDHKDVFAAEVIAVLLGQGESSRLIAQLKRDKALINNAFGFAHIAKDPGLLIVGFVAPPGKAQTAVGELQKQVAKLRTELVSESELKKARTIVLGQTFYQKKTCKVQRASSAFSRRLPAMLASNRATTTRSKT